MALIELNNITKLYEGLEPTLRGTKLQTKGPALWIRNMVRAMRLTNNTASVVHALRGVSFSVNAGEIFGLVGRNGSGKTTLIKILAGLIRPTDGEGHVAGIPLSNPQDIRRRVSYVSTSGWMDGARVAVDGGGERAILRPALWNVTPPGEGAYRRVIKRC